MTDRFDEAKAALGSVPAHDMWSEAESRARGGSVVPLAPAAEGRARHRGRWLAAAAAAAVLIAGTVAVLADDGDPKVESGTATPGSDDPADPDVAVVQADGGCKLGIVGEAPPGPVTVSQAETHVVDDDGQPAIGTLIEGPLNDVQTYAVQVPGQVVIDLVGERVEDVQLQRGTAQLWFQSDGPVQVRWFTGSQETCESFTVTVGGGSEDENRHAAVDLAERVLISSEVAALPDEHPTPEGNPLAGTEWQLERSTIDGEPTEGDGSTFTFGETKIDWTDGCNSRFGSYTYAAEALTLYTVGSTDVHCEPNPTSDAVDQVLTEGSIAATIEGDLLVLRHGTAVLTLRPTS